MTFDDESLRAHVRTLIGENTISAWARSHALNDEQVASFLRGIRPAEPKLLRVLGLTKRTLYVGMNSR